jgi:8-oxo-dGTP pyrophosphatase MutT (NUDIX family)
MRITRDLVRKALTAPLNDMWRTVERAIPAAVVVPVRIDPEPYVVAILRASSLKEHSNEVAFPGGKAEATDADLRATAFRELLEEVGIREEQIEDLGRLSPIPVVTGKYVIHPFVAELAEGAEPAITSPEIARLLRIPILPWLTGDLRISEVSAPWRGGDARVPHFDLEGCVLYGASAFVFFELLTKIARALDVPMPPGVLTTDNPWKDRYAR